MRKSTYLPSILLILCTLLSPATAEKPNVLLICVDDLKPLLGCYGDPHAITPNIDKLAKRAVLLEAAYCNQAICAPSRNALMTGLRPQTLGIYDLGTNFRKARPDAVTLSQQFHKHGYRTEALGKIYHSGHGNGEDVASWNVKHFSSWKAGTYKLPENQKKEAKGPAYESADVPDSAYSDGLLASETMKRLKQAKNRSDTPFFIGLGFAKPHLPFCAPKKYWDLYDPAKLPLATITEPPTGAPSFLPHNSEQNYVAMR